MINLEPKQENNMISSISKKSTKTRLILVVILIVVILFVAHTYISIHNIIDTNNGIEMTINKGVIKTVPEGYKVVLSDATTVYAGQKYDLSDMVLILPSE